MASFHKLEVKEVKRETQECVSILFDVPNELQDTFQFIQGQYLTLRIQLNGEEVRRSYSICSSPYGTELRVAVKKIPDGKFSTYANTVLKSGDVIDVMAPMGNFYTDLAEENEKKYAAFSSGSGITPIISIIRATLKAEPKSKFTLFYGNKNNESIIFNDDINHLKQEYSNRFEVYHVFSRQDDVEPPFKGRLSADKCRAYHQDLIDLISLDEVFLCGPEQMIFELKDALVDIGLSVSNIHFELFTSAKKDKQELQVANVSVEMTQVEVVIDGDSYHFELAQNADTILDAAIAADADVPFACKGGVCCACKAKVMEGTVRMEMNYGLDEDEVEDGYVLTCQSHPTSKKLIIDFDEI